MEGIHATIVSSTQFQLEDISEGTATVHVSASLSPTQRDQENCPDLFPNATPIYIEHKYTIKGYTLEKYRKTNTLLCENTLPNVWVRNTRIRDLGILLTSPTGNQFSPANAQSTHPTNLWITAPLGTHVTDQEQGFYSLQSGYETGTLTIEAEFGSPIHIEIIDESNITGWSPSFELAGQTSGGLELTTGETYGKMDGIAEPIRTPTLSEMLKKKRIRCAPIPIQIGLYWKQKHLIHVSSMMSIQKNPEIYGESLGLSASLIADGECRLTLTAPSLHGGEGLKTSFHGTFYNTSELFMD